MFITWKHEATSTTGGDATGDLNVKVDMHLYNNIVVSENPAAARRMHWLIQLVNPDETEYFDALRDIWFSTAELASTVGK